MEDFITAFGLVLILEGIPYFLVPMRMRQWMAGVVQLPDRLLRKAGFFLMSFGLLIVYWIRG